MTNFAKMKKGKGTPPALAPVASASNLDKPPREKEQPTKPLQFKVTEDVFEAFSKEAFERFGHSKGAKKALFEAMWASYQTSK